MSLHILGLLCKIFSVIPDPLNITDAVKQVIYHLFLTFCQRKILYLNQILCQHLFHIIDCFFRFVYLLDSLCIACEKSIDCHSYILKGNLSHMNHFQSCCFHSKGRRFKNTLIQMLEGNCCLLILRSCRRLLLRLLPDNNAGNLYQLIGKGEEKGCHGKVKYRMENRNLHRINIGCGKIRSQGKENKAQTSYQNSSDYVKGQVNHSGPLRYPGAAHTGKHSRYTGTDILSQSNINCCIRSYNSIHCQSLQNSH